MTEETPMIGITRRVVLSNKEDITFQVALDPKGGIQALNETLDMISAGADRERLKAELAEKEQAHKIALQQFAYLDHEIARLRADRAAALAGMQVAHATRGKRSDFQINERQQQQLDQFDAQIRAAAQSKENFKRDKPIIEWEMARLKALIAGEPEPEKPPEVEQAMADLAEAA